MGEGAIDQDRGRERRKRDKVRGVAMRGQAVESGRAFYRPADLCARYSISRPTLWDWWAKRKIMPAPVSLGPNVKAWPCEVIHAWEQAKAAAVTD